MKTLCLFLALTALVSAQNALDPTWVSATTSGNITSAGTTTDCAAATSCVWIVGPSWALSAKVVISGTFSGTLVFESATDGKTWGSVPAVTGATNTTGTGTYYFQIPQVPCLRIRASGLASGSAQIAITALNYVPVIPATTSSGSGATQTLRFVTGSTSMGAADYMLLVNAVSGPAHVVLPAAPQNNRAIVKKTDNTANAITIAGAGTSTIDGRSSYTLAAKGDCLEAIFDGTNWWIL